MIEGVLALDVTAGVVGVGGVARHAVHLPDALEALGVPVHRFAVGGRRCSDPRVRHLRVPVRVMQRLWATGHPTATALVGARPALVHSLDLVPPPTKSPTLLTVHDLGGLERPDLHSTATLAAAQRQLSAARVVDLICAVSEATKDVLIDQGIPVDRVVVTPNGMTPLPDPQGPPVIDAGYVLMVGTVSLRKGYDVVVRAMAQLPDVRLVIAGPDGWGAEQTATLIEASPARDRITRLDWVDDATLSRLLRDAACQVIPSRIEGFGIPLLEAMSRQLPVVCSDIPALREVGGSVPIFVPVDDVDATADGIRRAMDRPRSDGGLTAVANYTWERTARAALRAYEQVLGRPVID